MARARAAEVIAAGLPFLPDADVQDISRNGDTVVVRFTENGTPREERFDWLLAATGRKPALDGLNLAASGLTLDDRGSPQSDPLTMQAENSHIFSAGDVAARIPLLHEAADDGRIAGDNAGRQAFQKLVVDFHIVGAWRENRSTRPGNRLCRVRECSLPPRHPDQHPDTDCSGIDGAGEDSELGSVEHCRGVGKARDEQRVSPLFRLMSSSAPSNGSVRVSARAFLDAASIMLLVRRIARAS